MPEHLEKLRPDRDLQCYFERPSGAVAISGANEHGFTVSGCWRQQFDWAVVEWNRDNVFEHPALRNLPDGDLSGLRLSYEEERQNCIPIDSSLYPTVDWPYLRIWAEDGGAEKLYKVPLLEHATPVEGDYAPASAAFVLEGAPTGGDYVELAWLAEHYTYQLYGADSLADAARALAESINAFSPTMSAAATEARITLTWKTAGANGNRAGVYGNVYGAATEKWNPGWQQLSGGASPTKWRVELDFGALRIDGQTVPTNAVRKMRWTWSADLQGGEFRRSEFQVEVSNWNVTGSGRRYRVAGPGSRRIEDDSADLVYTGRWTESRGNFSGGSIRYSTEPGASVSCTYRAARDHKLYMGTRRAAGCAKITVALDGGPARTLDMNLPGEDVLVREFLGEFDSRIEHRVVVRHAGPAGAAFYLDFLEAAATTEELPEFEDDPQTTLATDWDTDHSIALPPERTAWLVNKLGFRGRANHYAGAMWFYELQRSGHAYARGTIAFSGTPEFGKTTEVWIGPTRLAHMNLIGDSPASIAKAFELEINGGSTGVWATAEGGVLTVQARTMGEAGNATALAANTNSSGFKAEPNGTSLAGGRDGNWRTDLTAIPRLNRAARDWNRSYFAAMKTYGIDVTAAFSMELQHGDDSTDNGIAQRYPDGTAVWLNTPALQTNFSPASLDYWKQVYLDMAGLMREGGISPFLQFGEVQWWYFPAPGSGMPFYDAYTRTRFEGTYGRPMRVIRSGDESPVAYPEESAFLPLLIGEFTDAVIGFVRKAHPDARFEVLYPPDVNDFPLNQVVNLPAAYWKPDSLDCFKTENFTYTGARDLNKARESIQLPLKLGFPRSKGSHLVGIGEYTTPWEKESSLSKGEGLESVVLFALDQFCLIGYEVPLSSGTRRSVFMGS